MADINLYFPKLLKFEGGYVNDPDDKGGATNMGVTIATFKSMGYDNDKDGDIDVQDLKLETPDEAKVICKKLYWDKWKADFINNQSVAESLVEWVWGSGIWGIKKPQAILGIITDGVVGNQTITAVNSHDPKELHESLREAKINFIKNIVANNPSQIKFYNGWLNRINAFIFVS